MGNPYLENPYTKLSEIPQPENLLQKAIKKSSQNVQQSGVRGALGGLMAGGPSLSALSVTSGTKKPEEGLPSGLQIGGNILGSEIGLLTSGAPVRGGAIGGTIGRTVGETGKQAIQYVLDKNPFSGKEIGKQAGIGAATETVAMPFATATNKLLSGAAGSEFIGKVGEQLGSVKNKIKASGIKTKLSEIVPYLRQIAQDLSEKVQIHPDLSKVINSVADDLERVGTKKFGLLDPEDVMRAQSFLKQEIKKLGVFSQNVKRGDYQDIGELIDAEEIAKNLVTKVADKSGLGKQFSNAKDVYGKIAGEFPKSASKHGILTNILDASAIHSLIRGDVAGAIGNTMAAQGVGSKGLIKGIYDLLKVGKSAPGIGAETISYLTKE